MNDTFQNNHDESFQIYCLMQYISKSIQIYGNSSEISYTTQNESIEIF